MKREIQNTSSSQNALNTNSSFSKIPQTFPYCTFLRQVYELVANISCFLKTTFLSFSSTRFLRSWVPRETRSFLNRNLRKWSFLDSEERILKLRVANIILFVTWIVIFILKLCGKTYFQGLRTTIMVTLNIQK